MTKKATEGVFSENSCNYKEFNVNCIYSGFLCKIRLGLTIFLTIIGNLTVLFSL